MGWFRQAACDAIVAARLPLTCRAALQREWTDQTASPQALQERLLPKRSFQVIHQQADNARHMRAVGTQRINMVPENTDRLPLRQQLNQRTPIQFSCH